MGIPSASSFQPDLRRRENASAAPATTSRPNIGGSPVRRTWGRQSARSAAGLTPPSSPQTANASSTAGAQVAAHNHCGLEKLASENPQRAKAAAPRPAPSGAKRLQSAYVAQSPKSTCSQR